MLITFSVKSFFSIRQNLISILLHGSKRRASVVLQRANISPTVADLTSGHGTSIRLTPAARFRDPHSLFLLSNLHSPNP